MNIKMVFLYNYTMTNDLEYKIKFKKKRTIVKYIEYHLNLRKLEYDP